MNDYILEVCVDSAESALAAAKGGASRLELCQNLVIGGTTPSPKLFEVIRRQTTIPIHALIRPRFGDFCYTPYELEEIREEVAMYRELGAEGVVVGVLKEDGTMNMAGNGTADGGSRRHVRDAAPRVRCLPRSERSA